MSSARLRREKDTSSNGPRGHVLNWLRGHPDKVIDVSSNLAMPTTPCPLVAAELVPLRGRGKSLEGSKRPTMNVTVANVAEDRRRSKQLKDVIRPVRTLYVQLPPCGLRLAAMTPLLHGGKKRSGVRVPQPVPFSSECQVHAPVAQLDEQHASNVPVCRFEPCLAHHSTLILERRKCHASRRR